LCSRGRSRSNAPKSQLTDNRQRARSARHQAFPQDRVERALALNVGLVAAALSPAARRAIDGLASDVDAFHVKGREVYWLCQQKQSDSKFSNAIFERTLKTRSTFRGAKTMTRLAERLTAAKTRN